MKKIFSIECSDVAILNVANLKKAILEYWGRPCGEEDFKVRELPQEQQYPCKKCGKMRTKDEGGTTFTVCDECWDNKIKPKEIEPLGIIPKDYNGDNYDTFYDVQNCINKLNEIIAHLNRGK